MPLLYDTINFIDPSLPGYVNENSLSDDGKKKKKEYFREGLERHVSNRKNNEPVIGTPSDEQERAVWYQGLEKIVKEVIRLAKEAPEENRTLMAREVLAFGAAAYHCGPRWKTEGYSIIKSLRGEMNLDTTELSTENSIETAITSYKDGVLEGLTENLTTEDTLVYQPHIFNYIAKIMIENGLLLSQDKGIDTNDTLIQDVMGFINRDTVIKKLDKYFELLPFTIFIMNEMNEQLKNNSQMMSLLIDAIRGYAESKIPKEKFEQLEGALDAQKIAYGKSKTQEVLNEEEIKLAIIKNDTTVLAQKNRMQIIEIKRRLEQQDGKMATLSEAEKGVLAENTNNAIVLCRNQLNNPQQFVELFRDRGSERATRELRLSKNALCDQFVEEANLLSFDEQLRPSLTLFGAYALLSLLGYADQKCDLSHYELTLDRTKAVGRRNLEENNVKIREEFQTGLYLRTFSDEAFEFTDVITTKLDCEKNPNKVDKRYWSSCSTVRSEYACDVWKGSDARCGLLFSSSAELGGWSPHDMGSENIPSTLDDANAIKNFFPAHFPDIEFREVEKALGNRDRDAYQLASLLLARPLELDNEEILEEAKSFLLERLDKSHGEHQLLLDRLPDKYKSLFSFDKVQEKMRKFASRGGEKYGYNEAKIHYKPNDILGVFVFNDPGSLEKGAKFQAELYKAGFEVPIVTYDERNGSLITYKTMREVPPFRRG